MIPHDGTGKGRDKAMADVVTRVCVLPYRNRVRWRMSNLPLTDLEWPLGYPEGLEGKTLADLTEHDHILTSPSSMLFLNPSLGTRAKVSVFFMEPRAIHAKYMQLVRLFHHRFHRVLTSDDALLRDVPNGIFFPLGGCWVPNWKEADSSKRHMCSLIASEKAKLPGHRLRHDMVNWVQESGADVHVMGRAYRPFADKADGLAPYRYSLVIENSQENGYFTEKLLDAFLLKTVPIYWGCPNIADFFDPRGMILCRDRAEVQAAVKAMSAADYDARQAALEANRQTAQDYIDITGRAARAVLAAG